MDGRNVWDMSVSGLRAKARAGGRLAQRNAHRTGASGPAVVLGIVVLGIVVGVAVLWGVIPSHSPRTVLDPRLVGSWKIDEGTGVGLRRVYRFLPDGQMDNLVVSPGGELVRQSTSIWWVENGELCLSEKLNYPVDAGLVVVLDKMLGHSAAKKHDVIVRLPLSEVSRDRVLVLKPAIPGEAALLKLKWTRFPEQ